MRTNINGLAIEDKKFKEEFPKRLRALMNDRKLNISQLSSLTGISKSLIHGYLNGKCLPKLENLSKLSETLDAATIVGDFKVSVKFADKIIEFAKLKRKSDGKSFDYYYGLNKEPQEENK